MATPSLPPQKATVLVIGGGPAGSYAATVLARENLDVVLVEAAQFPRYHVGEGMLPSMRHYLDYIDCEEKFEHHGFMHKPGACFKLRQDLRETFADFNALGPKMTTWNVVRADADKLLLDHAVTQGVKVFERTKVTGIDFKGPPDTSRPVSASWSNKSGASGVIDFDWLVDASGRYGILSTQYLRNRKFRESLRNIAVWGYWKDVTPYEGGTARANAPWNEAMSDGLGWAWLIPLHDGTTSIGVVMHQSASNSKRQNREDGPPSLQEHYLEQLKFLPGVQELIGRKGSLVQGSVRASQDYSYSAGHYSGDHFRIVGDAANFVDPFFSSGVHVALTGALSAATTICASMKNQVEESQAQLWHDTKVGISHTRFLLVVLGAYKQMNQQQDPVLTDVNEDNFDAAFQMFRPVITGLSDNPHELNDHQIKQATDFCARIFDPEVDHVNVAAVRQRYDPSLSTLFGPVLSHESIADITNGDEEGARVMMKMNALKLLRDEADFSILERDGLNGFVAVTKRGHLGLRFRDQSVAESH